MLYNLVSNLQFKCVVHMIVNYILINEALVVIVHNSKSKRKKFNVYIYCCIKKHVISKEMSSKRRNQERRPSNHCDFKKNVPFVLL